MSHPQEQHGQSMPQGAPARSAFGGSRLELPRFQFAPRTPQPAPAQAAVPAPRHSPAHHHGAPAPSAPAPVMTAAPMLAPTVRPHVHGGVTHAPTWGASPTGYHVPAAVSVAVAPPASAAAHRPPPSSAARAMASTATRPVSVSWDHVDPAAERGLLQRITPVHMGVLMVLVMVMMVVTSGPAAMTATPARLPAATIDGGGGSVPMPVRAGTAATAAATGAAAPKPTAAAKAGAAPGAARAARPAGSPAATAAASARPATPRARMLQVGSGRVRARVRAGGIPSPAASANLAIAGGGRVRAADTGSVRMAGIPSPAASEQLGPQTLPFRPTDGVTLPRATGERDSHALDTHYAPAQLAMEEPALPAMTPGAAAAQAERQVTINQLSGGSTPAPVAGGLATAY